MKVVSYGYWAAVLEQLALEWRRCLRPDQWGGRAGLRYEHTSSRLRNRSDLRLLRTVSGEIWASGPLALVGHRSWDRTHIPKIWLHVSPVNFGQYQQLFPYKRKVLIEIEMSANHIINAPKMLNSFSKTLFVGKLKWHFPTFIRLTCTHKNWHQKN